LLNELPQYFHPIWDSINNFTRLLCPLRAATLVCLKSSHSSGYGRKTVPWFLTAPAEQLGFRDPVKGMCLQLSRFIQDSQT
jgi:hypothetical protein